MTPSEYWQSNRDLKHITPPGEQWPEIGLVQKLLEICNGSVFEFGCGYGRLATTFDPELYHGFDINPAALKAAQRINPAHSFSNEPKQADTFLAHTVLMHIPDSEIQEVLEFAKNNYQQIVIGEIMGRVWRRGGNPPVFNREAKEYDVMMGMESKRHYIPYPRYGCDLTILEFNQ